MTHADGGTDGREVAVKIQYPGADLALDADLRTLQRFSRLFVLVVPGLDARALIRELRERMLDELDYRAEADRQRAFAAAFAGSDRLVVPAVVAAAPKVLVSEWAEGSTSGRSPVTGPSIRPIRPSVTATPTLSSRRCSPPRRWSACCTPIRIRAIS